MTIDFTTNIDTLLAELANAKANPRSEPKTSVALRKVPSLIAVVEVASEAPTASPEALAQSLYITLANESRRISAEISGVLGDLDVEVEEDVQDISEELSVELNDDDDDDDEVHQAVEVITHEEVQDLVSRSAELLSTLEDVNYKPDADNAYLTDVGQLARRIEVMQNTLGQLTSVGWGQAGLTYGSGEVRLEFLDDVNRDSAKTDGMYLQYQSSSGKWIGSASTETGFDPSGYEYTNDSSLYLIENDTDDNGLVIEEGEWTKLLCSGYTTNNLPTGAHGGIAGSTDYTGSGSTTYSRIWDTTLARFYFDELDIKTVLIFRLKVDMIPETNNTLVQARINFYAMRDGQDDPVLEDATIASEYYTTLEDETGDIVQEDGTSKFNLETGTDMGQGDYPGSYNDTNYKIELETATDGGTGQLKGDTFLAYNFQQTVAAQELADGAGVEQERSFVFPIYVGDASSQRGFGEFEIFTTAEMVVNDTSILGFLN